MKTIEDLKKLLEQAETLQNSLISIMKDEKKEEGKPRDNTIIHFNALIYSYAKAFENLEKGLKGEF